MHRRPNLEKSNEYSILLLKLISIEQNKRCHDGADDSVCKLQYQ